MTFIHSDDNCVYTALALALAATTNQRRLSLSMTYGNSNLRSAHTDISPRNFHIYQSIADDIDPLLGYMTSARPHAMCQG